MRRHGPVIAPCTDSEDFPDGFSWDDLRKVFRGYQRVASVSNGVENIADNFIRLSKARRNVTDRRLRWPVSATNFFF